MEPNRHSALKLRHREAILEAARELITERGGPAFTIDDLAARADVGRRTVFNHFTGLDDVLLTVCADTLSVIVDDFLSTVAGIPVGDGSPSSMFDELATATRASDLPTAIVTVLRILGITATSRSRHAILSDAVSTRVSKRLVAEVGRRNSQVDGLDAELLASSLMHGIGVIAERWVEQTGGRIDAESLAEWSALLERLLRRMRSGYMPT
jgi:TetR/AcrR family transcriptional regulator of autoinduction and epiphytic fitness